MTGLNIQTPWSQLLIDGHKSVETRSYALPTKYEGVDLALIETPGKYGKFKSRIIGTCTFSHCFKYPDRKSWINDYNRHRVEETDAYFAWNDKPKYGWVVSKITKLDKPITILYQKGIVFRNNCCVAEHI